MKYTELTTETGTKVIVRDNKDGSVSYIPIDESNSDYQAYLNPDKLKHLTEIVADETPIK